MNKLFHLIILPSLIFTTSINAGKLTIYLNNETMDPSESHFQRVNQRNKKILKNDQIPLVPEDYNGTDQAYFSIPVEAEGDDYHQYYKWFSAPSTEVVVGIEDKEGSGSYKTFPFQWKKGFHAFTINLTDELKDPTSQLERVHISLRSKASRYPGELHDISRRNLATDSIYPMSLDHNEDTDVYSKIAVLRYANPSEPRQIGNIVNLVIDMSGDHDEVLKKEGIKTSQEK